MENRRKTHHFDAISLRRQVTKPIRKQSIFHRTHFPAISRLETTEKRISNSSFRTSNNSFIEVCHSFRLVISIKKVCTHHY